MFVITIHLNNKPTEPPLTEILAPPLLPSLAFVPENEVCDCFSMLMGEFPQGGIEVAEYFE